jgi:uncharacterized protein (TIRG00374 family)
MKKKLAISLLIGTLVSATTLYFAFENVPFGDLVEYLGAVDYIFIVPATAAIVAAFVFRALRWRAILGAARQVSFSEAFHPLMIGFMANCVYPGRIGEIGRPLILKARSGVPFSTGLATVGVERLIDLVCLILLFGLALQEVDLGAGGTIRFSGYEIDGTVMVDAGKGMLLLAALIFVGVATITAERTRGLVHKTIALLPRLLFFLNDSKKKKFAAGFTVSASTFVENIAAGFALVKSPRLIVVCAAYSALVWAFTVYSYYIMAKGSPGIDLTALEITAVMVMICFAIVLPSVPGYWGLWEAGGVFALSLFGVGQKDAAGYTLVNHAVQVLPVILIGLVSAWIAGVKMGSIAVEKDDRIVGRDDLAESENKIREDARSKPDAAGF